MYFLVWITVKNSKANILVRKIGGIDTTRQLTSPPFCCHPHLALLPPTHTKLLDPVSCSACLSVNGHNIQTKFQLGTHALIPMPSYCYSPVQPSGTGKNISRNSSIFSPLLPHRSLITTPADVQPLTLQPEWSLKNTHQIFSHLSFKLFTGCQFSLI